tara:strand:- start:499 stop:759 length:261 start_codon:yes stop_codon:yes gene_type:complete
MPWTVLKINQGEKQGEIIVEKDNHGQPGDRGSADFWYHRPPEPHYWPSGTGKGLKVDEADMTDEQVLEYHQGYGEALRRGYQKDYV